MRSRKTAVQTSSIDEEGVVKSTKIGEPKSAFTAMVRECELALNLSYDVLEIDDGDGNKVKFCLWVNGDWKIEYKDKEYLIACEDNVNAFIEWLKKEEK